MIVIDYNQVRNSLVLSISSLALLLCSLLGTNYNLLWQCHVHPYLIIVISCFHCWDWSARLNQNQWGLKPWSSFFVSFVIVKFSPGLTHHYEVSKVTWYSSYMQSFYSPIKCDIIIRTAKGNHKLLDDHECLPSSSFF